MSTRSLSEIEAGIRAIPLTLPTGTYKERLHALDAEWRAANVALFDAQVAALQPAWDAAIARLEELEG